MQARRTKNFAFLLLSGALVVAAAVQLPGLMRRASSARMPQWTSWHMRSLEITGGDDVLQTKVREAMSLAPGMEITKRRARRLEMDLPKLFPSIRKAEISRSLFGGHLRVSIYKRVPVARATGFASPQLVDETGEIYPARPGEGEELLPVSFPPGFAGESVGPEIARLAGAIKSYGGDFPVKPVSANYDNRTDAVTVTLADGSLLEWGSLEFTAEKISRLAQVFPRAQAKIQGPYSVNLRYFEKGRIIVNRLSPATTAQMLASAGGN